MKYALSCFSVMALCLICSAHEVPVFNETQKAFLAMTPVERRAQFTDEAFRNALAAGYISSWTNPTGDEDVWTLRFRRLAGVKNMRDMGGLTGLNGRKLKTGLVFRSGGFNKNADGTGIPGETKMTEETIAYQIANFGIKTDLDIRGWSDVAMKTSPLGDTVKLINIGSQAYAAFFGAAHRDTVRELFAVFLDQKNYPIAFHCAAGADRTGSLAYFLEALLGVSDEDLCLDWELTAFSNYNVEFAHAERYDKLVEALANNYSGNSTREKAESFIRSCGYTDLDILKFRSIMLEPSSHDPKPYEGHRGAVSYMK